MLPDAPNSLRISQFWLFSAMFVHFCRKTIATNWRKLNIRNFRTNYANSEILRMEPIKCETAKKKVKYYVLCSFCHGLELPIGLARHTTSPAPGLSQRNHLTSKSIAERRHLRSLLRSTRSGFHLHLGSKRSWINIGNQFGNQMVVAYVQIEKEEETFHWMVFGSE